MDRSEDRPQSAAPARQAGPLSRYRRLIHGPADRVRWACALEAIAPKLGNVHPSRSFVDLQVSDFLTAGDQLAAVVEEEDSRPVGQTILEAVRRCRERTGTNVNLGIALLVVPLVRAERWAKQHSCSIRQAMREVLAGLDSQDGQDAFEAIRWAQPGGLGRTSRMDVSDPSPVDLLDAMRSAADRDAIAFQYSCGFEDLFDSLVPLIDSAIADAGDVLLGIREAQLRMLARAPDSLIARKCGAPTAAQGQAMAAELLGTADAAKRADAETNLDAWLRGDGHRRNPGTTADLIAAGLFVLLGSSDNAPHSSAPT